MGNQLDICWQIGPAGFPYSITLKQVQPPGAPFQTTLYFGSGGPVECFNGFLEASDVPGVQFTLTVLINGVTLNETSPFWTVNP